jgi:hypothetical protein
MRFEELKQYKAVHGHCNVPQTWDVNPQLGKWVDTQRAFKKKGKMSPERQVLVETVTCCARY